LLQPDSKNSAMSNKRATKDFILDLVGAKAEQVGIPQKGRPGKLQLVDDERDAWRPAIGFAARYSLEGRRWKLA
jgi:hypothetical protein